jgi:ribosomal protein L14
MLQKSSYVVPADRCGVFWVNIFHLYKGSFRKKAYIGDFVKISVKLTQPDN